MGRKVKHGMSDTNFYARWTDMRRRCLKKDNRDYPNWGGRGIKICDRWMEFLNFKEDMYDSFIEMAEEHGMSEVSIDRIDNDGDWSTRSGQASNRRSSKFITFDGITDTKAGWADRIGISRQLLNARLKGGVPLEEALKSGKYKYRYKHFTN